MHCGVVSRSEPLDLLLKERRYVLHLFVVPQTYLQLANCVVLLDIVRIMAVHTATSFSQVVSVKRRITAGLIADRGLYEPTIPTDKTLESYRTVELRHREGKWNPNLGQDTQVCWSCRIMVVLQCASLIPCTICFWAQRRKCSKSGAKRTF